MRGEKIDQRENRVEEYKTLTSVLFSLAYSADRWM